MGYTSRTKFGGGGGEIEVGVGGTYMYICPASFVPSIRLTRHCQFAFFDAAIFDLRLCYVK